jgi:uncharacterized membrane protein YjgN (DUF898 family)
MYFYGHSLVAHSPLGIHRAAAQMVLGFVLLALISIAYQIAAKTGQDLAVGLMLLAGAVLAPYLWASAMRFRLGATRWRGCGCSFRQLERGVPGQLARVCLALVWFGVFFGCRCFRPNWPRPSRPGRQRCPKVKPQFTAPMGALLGLGLLLSILCYPARIQLQKPAGAARPPGRSTGAGSPCTPIS